MSTAKTLFLKEACLIFLAQKNIYSQNIQICLRHKYLITIYDLSHLPSIRGIKGGLWQLLATCFIGQSILWLDPIQGELCGLPQLFDASCALRREYNIRTALGKVSWPLPTITCDMNDTYTSIPYSYEKVHLIYRGPVIFTQGTIGKDR